MATLAVSRSSLTGATPTFVAATAGGDTFPNDGNALLIVKTAGTVVTVTVDSIKPCDQGSDHNVVVVLAATAETTIGPFPVARFGRSPAITYSVVTACTVAVVTE